MARNCGSPRGVHTAHRTQHTDTEHSQVFYIVNLVLLYTVTYHLDTCTVKPYECTHMYTKIKVNKVNTANKLKFIYVLNEGIRYQVYLLFVPVMMLILGTDRITVHVHRSLIF